MTEPRIPNLFLIGAPKCGTTAMSHYLAGHPDIFMSEQAGIKEPHFFAGPDDWIPSKNRINSWQKYSRLFRAAPPSAKYIGEASVSYLSSEKAVPRICKTCQTTPRF